MKIQRKRYVIMRYNRTEICGGRGRNFYFRRVNDVCDFPIKTYSSEKQAIVASIGFNRECEIVPVVETLEYCEE